MGTGALASESLIKAAKTIAASEDRQASSDRQNGGVK